MSGCGPAENSTGSQVMDFVLPNAVRRRSADVIQPAAGPSSQHMIQHTIIPQYEHKDKPKKKIRRFFLAVWKAVKRPFQRGKNKVASFVPPSETDDEASPPEMMRDVCPEEPKLTPTPPAVCAALPLLLTDTRPADPVRIKADRPVKFRLLGGGILGKNDSDPTANRPKDAAPPVNEDQKNDRKPDVPPAGPVPKPCANPKPGPKTRQHSLYPTLIVDENRSGSGSGRRLAFEWFEQMYGHEPIRFIHYDRLRPIRGTQPDIPQASCSPAVLKNKSAAEPVKNHLKNYTIPKKKPDIIQKPGFSRPHPTEVALSKVATATGANSRLLLPKAGTNIASRYLNAKLPRKPEGTLSPWPKTSTDPVKPKKIEHATIPKSKTAADRACPQKIENVFGVKPKKIVPLINPKKDTAAISKHDDCRWKRTGTNLGIPKTVTRPANPKTKAVAEPVKQQLKAFPIPKKKPEIKQKPEFPRPRLVRVATDTGANLARQNINAVAVPKVPQKTERVFNHRLSFPTDLDIPKASPRSIEIKRRALVELVKRQKESNAVHKKKSEVKRKPEYSRPHVAEVARKKDATDTAANLASPNINTGAIPKVPQKTEYDFNPWLTFGTHLDIPKAGTSQADSKRKAVAEPVKKQSKDFNIAKKKCAIKEKPVADAEREDEPTPNIVSTTSFLYKYHYDLNKMIGQGSFGTVYEGIRESDGMKVAIKRMQIIPIIERYIKVLGYSEPLLAEVALMLKMQKSPISPYVIQMYDWHVESNYVTIVLEYGASETLHRYLCSHDGSKLPETTACQLMHQAVLAVKHCLNHGVFHSDLHSGNFLVDRVKMNLKLIDFGCAHVKKERGYLSEDFLGALCYRPPEVFTKRMYHAVPTSVWSLGVLLYRMLHGFLPFPQDHIPKAEDFQIHERDLSEDVCDLMKKCLTIDPYKRPTVLWMLKHRWLLVGKSARF